ncbi:STAS domain-containing protein [Rhodobacteraceae bacterium ASV31]|nr:STAS domain-containing protein [Anianabacter salinae]
MLETVDHDGLRVVAVTGARVDAAICAEFKDALLRATQEAPGRVVLDLSAVRFLDSSGLGAVIAVMKALAPARRLELTGVSGAVEKVFLLTRMDRVFVIHPDLGEVVDGLRRAS